MSRIVNRPCTVTVHHGHPEIIIDGDTKHVVSTVIDWWMESQRSWQNESPRTGYRFLTANGGMYDVEFENDSWVIYRVWY